MTVDRTLPAAVLESHIGILGKTGSGKSNLAKTIVEGLLDDGARVCVIDPTGTWFGLRLTRQHKPSPYRVVMFGGNHADIAIGRTHGAAVAETIGTTTTPAVIDTRTMTVRDRTEFFTAFAETLLQRNKGPLHLVVDEAHLFAPQGRVNDPRSGEMVHAANNLVSLGRGVGLRIILISQRPAKLHKDSLTQVETLVAMRLIAPQDRRAIDDWIGEWADPKQGAELIASLPSLRTGEAWIWSPEAGILERRQVPLARTLDTGKPSSEAIELGTIDIAAVQERLGEVGKDVLANDPKTLRAQLVELRRQLAERPQETRIETVERIVEKPVLNGQVGELRAVLDGMTVLGTQLQTVATSLITAIERVGAQPSSDPNVGRVPVGPRGVPARASAPAPAGGDLHSVAATRPVAAARPVSEGAAPLGKAERLILAALAQYGDRTPVQVAILTGYSANGGGFRNALGRVRSLGLVEGRDRVSLTSDGRVATSDVEPPPTGRALREHWYAQLGRAERLALEALVEAWPSSMTAVQVAERAGYEATGGGFRNALGKLRTLQLIEGRADLVAAAELGDGS